MDLSRADITTVLEGVESAPPSSGNAGAAILSSITAGPSKVLAFGRSSAAQMSLDDIFAALDDMTLPQKILEQALPVFSKAGFAVETAEASVPYVRKSRPYTAATRGDVRLALLHMPPQFFDDARAWGSFGDAIENIEGRVRMVSQGREGITPGFNLFLKKAKEKRDKVWTFVSWGWVEAFLAETDSIEQVFELPEPTNPGGGFPGSSALKLKPEDRQAIIDVFAFWAANSAAGGKEFFDGLVSGASWPKEFKDNMAGRWSGNPATDATRLLDYLIEQNRIPRGDPHPEDTYLGWILNPRMKSLGNPNRQNIARIIVDYRLLTREEDLKDAKKFKSEG